MTNDGGDIVYSSTVIGLTSSDFPFFGLRNRTAVVECVRSPHAFYNCTLWTKKERKEWSPTLLWKYIDIYEKYKEGRGLVSG